MLESKSDVCIYTDSDMVICNNNVYQGVSLAKLYGMCIPANPRTVLKNDLEMGVDAPKKGTSHYEIAKNHDHMFSFNAAPIFYSTNNKKARDMLVKYLDIFNTAPVRGPSGFNVASLLTGYFPCLLPYQWCVSRDNLDNEVILHVGKQQVIKKYFKV